MQIEQILSERGFEKTYWVSTRHSVADIFKKKDRCGIYVLHFSDGAYYVGQTIDIVKRFTQHCQTHSDIERISFKAVNQEELDKFEVEAIGAVESHHPLRNISLASYPHMDSDLDVLIPIEEQEAWLHNGFAPPKQRKRVVDEALRYKYAKKFTRLMKEKVFVDEILPVMKKYVARCIPEPYLTEIAFWGCSCLPWKNKEIVIFSRINIYWQELFTVGYLLETNEPVFSWHLAASPFYEISEEEFTDRYPATYPSLSLSEHKYPSGGQDQCTFRIHSSTEADKLLDDDLFVRATKTFNLRLMRKGGMNWGYAHCMDLADLIMP